jgi:AcrR family transcriptional regulator
MVKTNQAFGLFMTNRANKNEKILSVAANLMSRKGYRGTTFQEIADKVGLDKSSLFHYFKNKEEMLLRILEKSIGDIDVNLRKIIMNKKLEPEEKLKEAIDNHLICLVKYRDNVNIYLNELGNLSKKNKAIYLDKKRRYAVDFEQIIADMKTKGHFNGLDTRIVANGLREMLNGVIKWFKNNGTLTIEQISSVFYRMIIEK